MPVTSLSFEELREISSQIASKGSLDQAKEFAFSLAKLSHSQQIEIFKHKDTDGRTIGENLALRMLNAHEGFKKRHREYEFWLNSSQICYSFRADNAKKVDAANNAAALCIEYFYFLHKNIDLESRIKILSSLPASASALLISGPEVLCAYFICVEDANTEMRIYNSKNLNVSHKSLVDYITHLNDAEKQTEIQRIIRLPNSALRKFLSLNSGMFSLSSLFSAPQYSPYIKKIMALKPETPQESTPLLQMLA